MSIQTVALVGANGNLGAPMLAALVGAGFRVSVVRRAESKSRVAGEDDGTVRALPVDAWTVESLTGVLAGHDAVVVTFPLRSVEQHLALAEAAAAAGVRRYIPADFGSVDARSERARQLVPLFEKKETVRRRLEALQSDTFGWTSVVGGHFFDWGLRENFLHVNLATRTSDVVLQPGGRSSLTTLARYGETVVRILRRGADDVATRNRVLFVQSFCVTQAQVQAAVEAATHSQGQWTVTHVDTDAYVAERKARADEGDLAAIEDLVFALGVMEGDWTTKGDEFAMDLLGFKDQDLDEEVRKVVV